MAGYLRHARTASLLVFVVFASLVAGSATGPGPSHAAAQPRLYRPSGLTVAANGNVYVADRGANRIMLFSPAGGLFAFWGSKGSRLGQFKGPDDVAVDGRGHMYVSDTGNQRVVKMSSVGGQPIAAWGNTPNRLIFEPGGIATDRAGNVYLADGQDQFIEKYSPQGKPLARLGSFPNPTQHEFLGPTDVAIDGQGNLYVTDYSWLVKLSPGGKELASWGRQHPGKTFQQPSGVAVDRAGHIYLADTGHNRVVKLSATGRRLAVWTGARGVRFNEPLDVAVGPEGAVFVADTFNARVVKFSPSGAVLGVWH